MVCCGAGAGYGRLRIIWPDPVPDQHYDGENGSGMDPGCIKAAKIKGHF